MHLFNMATLFVVLTLLGVEFSVSAFVNPAASRLEPESHLKMLSRSALVLGKVMPVWYSVSTLFSVYSLALLAHAWARNPAYSGCDLGSYFRGIDLCLGSTRWSRGRRCC
jgi:hypothetical protein